MSDAELAARVRGGERDAFGVLWSRHSSAAQAVARQFRSIADPEDIAQEVSRRIFDVLLRGNGPTGDFRPYINQTVRNTAVSIARRPSAEPVGDAFDFAEENIGEALPDYADSAVERIITIRAFKALNARWQEVLWYVSVEGMTSEEAAVRMGLSANATAALANRAREGLRLEWLRAHTADETLPDECRWVVDRLPALERGTITERNRQRVERHIAECAHCARVAEELNDLAMRLPLVLLPLLLAGVDIVGSTLQTLLATKVSASAIAASAAALSSSGAGAATTGAALGVPVATSVGSGIATAAGAESVRAAAVATTSVVGRSLLTAKLAVQGWWAVGGVAVSVALVTALAMVVWPTSDSAATDLAGPGRFPHDAVVLPTPVRESADPKVSPSSQATRTAPSTAPSAGTSPRAQAPVGAGQGPAADGNGDENAGGGDGDGGAPVAPALDPMTQPGVESAPADGQLTWVSDLTFSGTGHPGWTVQVLNNGSVIGSATVAANGTWSYTPTVTSNAPMELTVRQTDGSRTSPTKKVGNYSFRAPEILSVTKTPLGAVGGVNRTNVRVSVDGDLRVRATLNGQTQSGTAPITLVLASIPDGTYTLTVVYVDTATGKVSAPVTQTVTL